MGDFFGNVTNVAQFHNHGITNMETISAIHTLLLIIFPSNDEKIQWPTSRFENVADFCHFVTEGGLDPYNHYNTCFVCKHR